MIMCTDLTSFGEKNLLKLLTFWSDSVEWFDASRVHKSITQISGQNLWFSKDTIKRFSLMLTKF